jgi:glycine cleavage system H protein
MDKKKIRYTPTHEWAYLEGDVATIGISRFAVDQLTDLIMLDLPKVGSRVTGGKSFGEIESVKAVSDLYSPVDGEVVAVNGDVAKNLELLADDPYEKGWLIKIKVSNPEEIRQLMDPETYEKKVAQEGH